MKTKKNIKSNLPSKAEVLKAIREDLVSLSDRMEKKVETLKHNIKLLSNELDTTLIQQNGLANAVECPPISKPFIPASREHSIQQYDLICIKCELQKKELTNKGLCIKCFGEEQ